MPCRRGCLTSWLLLGRIRSAFRIRPKCCFSFCAAARRTDCHVAPLLAMTCSNLPPVRIIPGHCRGAAGKRPCNCKSASSFCIPPRQTLLHPLTPGKVLHALAQTSLHPRTRLFLQHVIANQCAHWCGNPFSQQGNLASWQYLWQIRSSCVFAGNSCFSFCPAAGDADCHVAPLLAMTCRRQQRVCGGSSVVPGEFAALFRIRLRHCSLLCPTAGDADCHVASLLAMTCRRRQRVCGGSSVAPGEFVTLFGFAQSTASRHALPQEMRIATSLRSSQ